MKNRIIISLFLFIAFNYLQAQESIDFKKVNLGFGYALNFEALDKSKSEEVGLSSTGFTLIDFRGRLSLFKYIVMDIGGTVSQFKDELPFSEAVVFTSGQLSGLPSSAKSEIVSGGWYYAIGGRAPLSNRFFLNVSVGSRKFTASRKIPDCSNCNKTEIDIDAGSFLRTGLSFITYEENAIGELDLLYTFYFKKEFVSTLGLGFFVYF